jgi:Glycosyltransferase Family 4
VTRLEISKGQRGAIYGAYGKCQQPEQAPRFQSLSHAPIMTDVRRDGPSTCGRSLKALQGSHLRVSGSRGCPHPNEMMHNCWRRQNPQHALFQVALVTMHALRGIAGQFPCTENGNEDRGSLQGMGAERMKAPLQHFAREPASGENISTILVAYHFFPSPEVGARRMSALARYLADQGRTVAVISAFAGLADFSAENSATATLAAYDLEHVPDRKSIIDALLVNGKKWMRRCVSILPRAKQNPTVESNSAEGHRGQTRTALHRALFTILRVIDDKKGWSIRAGHRLRSLAARHAASVVVVSAPPISPLWATVFTARKLKLPVVVDLRDPITDIGAADDSRSRSQRWGARGFVERYVIRHADAIVTTTPGLRDRLQSKYPAASGRITCIFNGFDGEMTPAKVNTEKRLTIVFAGELYLNRNPFPFLEAVDRLLNHSGVDESRVRVVFAGQCEFHNGISVRAWSSARPCGRVLTIHPPLDATRLKRLYDDATLLLNFAEGQPIQVPAKTFELLSLGREVLVACEPYSDTSRIIAGINGVFGVLLSETERLDDLLRSFYRRHVVEGRMSPPARESVLKYSREIQNEHYRALIDSVALRATPFAVEGG